MAITTTCKVTTKTVSIINLPDEHTNQLLGRLTRKMQPSRMLTINLTNQQIYNVAIHHHFPLNERMN